MRLPWNRCPDDAPELIELYLRHRLSVKENRQFEEHLLGCSGCRNTLDQMEEFLKNAREERAVLAAVSFPQEDP